MNEKFSPLMPTNGGFNTKTYVNNVEEKNEKNSGNIKSARRNLCKDKQPIRKGARNSTRNHRNGDTICNQQRIMYGDESRPKNRGDPRNVGNNGQKKR